MEISGKIIVATEVRSGQSARTGNNWMAQDFVIETHAIIKGDSLSHSIAAASILAKVARDEYMLEEAKKYPEYFFEKHKGYGTKLHIEMLNKYGPCAIHRKGFLRKILNNE